MPSWLPDAPQLALVGAVVVVGWLCWKWQKDEDEESRLGICAKDWKAKRERVARNMSDPWQRAERKLFGIRTGIERVAKRAE